MFSGVKNGLSNGRGALKPKTKPQARARAGRVVSQQSMGISRAVSAPVSMASTVSNVQPRINYSGRNSCRIAHRELIATINHSVNFATTKFEINPGLAATFPWLAPMAAQWEQYRFVKLAFHYVTRTATTTIGSVLLAPDYDASDPAPSSEINMASYQDNVEDVPWKNLSCTLNPSSMHVIQQRKYLRTAAAPVGTDLKLYDAGNFFVGTTGGVGTDAIGKLYVEYDVEFFIPQKTGGSAGGASFAYSQATQTLDANQKLFDAPVAIIAAATAPAGSTFTVPSGNWMFVLRYDTNTNETRTITMYVNGVAVTEQQLVGKGPDRGQFVVAVSANSTVDFRLNAGAAQVAFTRMMLTAVALC